LILQRLGIAKDLLDEKFEGEAQVVESIAQVDAGTMVKIGSDTIFS
jgi:hypothetical protein